MDEIYGPEEVATVLGIGTDAARVLMRDGNIRARLTNRHWRCCQSDVAEYVKNVSGPYIRKLKETPDA